MCTIYLCILSTYTCVYTHTHTSPPHPTAGSRAGAQSRAHHWGRHASCQKRLFLCGSVRPGKMGGDSATRRLTRHTPPHAASRSHTTHAQPCDIHSGTRRIRLFTIQNFKFKHTAKYFTVRVTLFFATNFVTKCRMAKTFQRISFCIPT